MTYKELFNAFNHFINNVDIKLVGNNIKIKYKKQERSIAYLGTTSISIKKLGIIKISHVPLSNDMENCVLSNSNDIFSFEYFSLNKDIKSWLKSTKYGIFFDITDGIISDSELSELPKNIFEWTEEDLFYFKLKYC